MNANNNNTFPLFADPALEAAYALKGVLRFGDGPLKERLWQAVDILREVDRRGIDSGRVHALCMGLHNFPVPLLKRAIAAQKKLAG